MPKRSRRSPGSGLPRRSPPAGRSGRRRPPAGPGAAGSAPGDFEFEIASSARCCAARSTFIPSRSVAVEGRIWASPEADSGVGPAIASGRPALSRKMIASSVSGATPCAPRRLDRGPEARRPLRRGDDSARAERVDHVRLAERGSGLEHGLARRFQGKRIRPRRGGDRCVGGDPRDPHARAARVPAPPSAIAIRGDRGRGGHEHEDARDHAGEEFPALAPLLAPTSMLGSGRVTEEGSPVVLAAGRHRAARAGPRPRRPREAEGLQVRRHGRRCDLQLGDPLGEGDRKGNDLAADPHKGEFGACKADERRGEGQGPEEQRQDGPERVRGLDAGQELQLPLLHGAAARIARTASSRPPRRRSQEKTIHFALSGDQDARPTPGRTTPYWNNFQVWKQIRAEKNDFNVLMGDTIYSDTEVPGLRARQDVALTVPQKWRKLQDQPRPEAVDQGARLDRLLRALGRPRVHQRLLARGEHFPLAVGDVNINGEKLYKRGVKAFREYNPVSYTSQTGIYRSLPLGQEPRDLLPRRALVPQRERRLPRDLRQPAGQRQPRPRPDRPAEHPQRVLGDRPAARQPGAARLHGVDQRPEPDDARLRAAAEVRAGDQELDRDLQGDLQRGPDPAVLRAALRPLGGIRGRAPGAAALPGRQRRRTPSS